MSGLPRSWKMKFPSQGKVREFCEWPGKFRKNLESWEKIREFENKWLRQAVFSNFIYSVQEGNGVHAHSYLPQHRGLLLKERICSLGEQILSFKSNP